MATTLNCSFQDLGDASRYSWQMCDHDQVLFFNFKNKYTKVYIHGHIDSVQLFLDLTSYNSQLQISKDARQAFYKERNSLIDLFLFTKGYNIEIETDKEKLKTLNKDAGQQVYDAMNPTMWKDIDALANAMLSYIPKHEKGLLAGGMPADFVKRIENNRAALLTAYEFLGVKEEEAKAATTARTLAGSELKAFVVAMFKDAQLVFRDDKETAKKYVWEAVLTRVRGPKETGFGGKITSEGAKTALANATITIPALNLSVVSDAEGKYKFSSLAVGTYDLEITCAGYEKKIVSAKDVKANIMGRLNIELVALAA